MVLKRDQPRAAAEGFRMNRCAVAIGNGSLDTPKKLFTALSRKRSAKESRR
jgi:hypothetical protein